MSPRGEVAGAARLVVVSGAPLLRPDVQLFEAMLEGWARQRASRQLAPATIDASAALVRRFQAHSGTFPWAWTPAHLEEWSEDLRAVRGLASLDAAHLPAGGAAVPRLRV